VFCYGHRDGPYRYPVNNNPIIRSPLAQIQPVNATPPPDRPGSIDVAAKVPSANGSPIPLPGHASPQPSDLFTPAVVPTTSCVPSSSTAAVTSTPLPALKNVLPVCIQSSPQEVDLPLANVLSPEEIAIIHEYRRRNGTSADFSVDPAHDPQFPVYSGLSTSLPVQSQHSVMPISSSVGLDPSHSVTSPFLSMSADASLEPELESGAQLAMEDLMKTTEVAGAFDYYMDMPEFEDPW